MEASLTLLIPLSVALVLLIGWVFWRALASGQFDDLERPAHDILMDDDRPAASDKAERPDKPAAPGMAARSDKRKPGTHGKPK